MKEHTDKLSIRQWAEADRPREKMISKGASALSDAELIAILIGSGNSRESAVELAQRILHAADHNLNSLGRLSVADLTSRFKGIGQAKAVSIVAALELGKRRGCSDLPERMSVRCSRQAFLLFYAELSDIPHEELWVAFTNRAAQVIGKTKISQGGTTETTADLRLILKAAIQALASGIILCHNHPSGHLAPSPADDLLTRQLQKAAGLFQISLLDHLIVADNCYYSYADEGKLSE